MAFLEWFTPFLAFVGVFASDWFGGEFHAADTLMAAVSSLSMSDLVVCVKTAASYAYMLHSLLR
jgi:hypothetical protein